MKRIYLDHAATTPVHPEVVAAMLPYFSDTFGNPSSIHSFGQEAKGAIDEARQKVAALISAGIDEIVFTSGGTEANNHALKGIAYANEQIGNHIITTPIEHHAVLEPLIFLEKRGFKTTQLPVDKYGMVDPQDVKRAITKDTILISIMHANNEMGTIEPIAEIAEIAREYEVYFHTDAVQTAGHIPINMNEIDVDLLSMSAHKLYGPKGIGALYIRKGTKLASFMQGGEQERRYRASTENVPGIVGFGKAAEIALMEMPEEVNRLTLLRDKLIEGLFKHIDNIQLNGHPVKRLHGNVNVSIDFTEGESLLHNLDLEGIAASSGSACSSADLKPSHVLLALGLSYDQAYGSLRLSLGRDTTEEDVTRVIEVLPRVVTKLRAMSPLLKSQKQ